MENENGKMNRRDLLKVIGVAPAAVIIPIASGIANPSQALHDSAATTQNAYKQKFFNDHEYRTFMALSDWIIPADERSGSATQAGVPECADQLLSISHEMMGTEVRGSLTWIDMECNRLYEHNFVDCTTAQQKQILDRIAYPDKAASADVNAAAAFNRVRDVVLGAFFSSEMGVKDLPYLGNKFVEEWNGCPEPDLKQLGVSYDEKWAHWKS